MMNPAELYRQHVNGMEDFWHRRHASPRVEREIYVFGQPVRIQSNDEATLVAVDHSLPSYSIVSPAEVAPFSIQLVVQSGPGDRPAAPDNLMQEITYSGHASWLMMELSQWGHAWIDLEAGRAVAVITPELSARPKLVSQCLLNTILLNFSIARGLGLLHASCLIKGDQALLLLGPHNAGKSTTALHLALAGFRLLTDSMVFIDSEGERLRLMGFPAGKIKLRHDILSLFPRLRRQLEREIVRDEAKFGLDLRESNRELVQEEAVSPVRIDLCLLSRHQHEETVIAPASEASVWSAIMRNSLYFDRLSTWERNLEQIIPMVESERAHHVTVGSDPSQLIKAISQL